jgi:ketosteroid isomerase-like protein
MAMKKILVIVAIFSLATMASAQSRKENQVAKAVQDLKKAMIDGDSVRLMKLSTSRLSYGHSSGTIEDQQTFVHNIASGNSDFVTIDLSEQTISVSGKTAIVRHTLIAATNDKGKTPGSVKLHVLTVWEKSGANWKLVARQAVKIP